MERGWHCKTIESVTAILNRGNEMITSSAKDGSNMIYKQPHWQYAYFIEFAGLQEEENRSFSQR